MVRRIPRIFNPNYQRNGTKSYVWLMSKYKFHPTKSGPYFLASQVHQQGKFSIHKTHHGHSFAAVAPGSSEKSAPSISSLGTPSSTQITAEDIQLDSEYLCPVKIGTPAQTLMLDFDTGSSDLWVWSTELPSSTQTQGGQAGHNIFNPSNSSTFKTMSGSTWNISYGDGSSASGNVGTDNVALGSVTITGQAVELAKTMSNQFTQDTGDGLLGLAWPNINTVKPQPVATPVQNMISQEDIPQSAELFTAYLGSWRDSSDPDQGESFYTFGEIDQQALNGQTPSYTDVDNSKGFWTFTSASVSINGNTIERSGNTAIADTGTTLCLVDDNTVSAIYNAIPGSKYDSTQQGYVFPTNTTADQLPDIAFPVGDTLIHVQKEDLAFADAGNGMVFGGIQSRGSNPFDILGDVFLKSAYVIFDQGQTRIGVVQRMEPEQNLQAPPAQGGAGS